MIDDKCAIILLASGLSRRFGSDDKLLALLNGKALGSYAAKLFSTQRTRLHCAVTPSNAPARTGLYRNHGWHILPNPAPEIGQGRSLAIAAKHLLSTDATAALIILADMPFVTETHLEALIDVAPPQHAMMSQCGEILQPPAFFPRSTFSQLAHATGDVGARAIFKHLPDAATFPIASAMARDVDTQLALADAHESPYHV